MAAAPPCGGLDHPQGPSRPLAYNPTAMTDAPLPHLILYRRAACALCDEARAMVDALLDDRRQRGLPTPAVEERDIDTNPAWQREHFATIPVLELGDARLETVTSLAKVRRLLSDQLDDVPAT
jgi:hypothetical protein